MRTAVANYSFKMPAGRAAQKSLKNEQLLRQQTEIDNMALRLQLERSQGVKAPLGRSVSMMWDWLCPCGNQCYAGRRQCLMCQGPRSNGYTLTGFVRGTLQSNQEAVQAQAMQMQVLGFQVGRVSRVGQPKQANTNFDNNINNPNSSSSIGTKVGGGYAPTQLTEPASWADVARRATAVDRKPTSTDRPSLEPCRRRHL